METVQYICATLSRPIGAILLCLSLSCLLAIRKKRWTGILLFMGCWILESMIIYIGDFMNLPPTLFAFLMIVWITCEGSALKKFTIGLMVASTVLACNTLIDSFFWKHGNWIFVYGRLIFAVFLFLVTKYLAPEKDYELSPWMWKLLLLLTVTPIGIVMSVVLQPDWYYAASNRSGKSMYIILLFLALFSFLGLLWTVSVLARQRKLEQQSMFAEINRNYYETMEQQHFEIRRLKHDLANHLQTLSALPAEKKEIYIQELLDNSPVTRTLNYCGDTTVNAVLTIKAQVMEREKISFQRKLEISRELPLEKADICALFANALDNAIEAARKLPPEKREIWLESHAGKGLLVISVKNSCIASDIGQTGINKEFPQTTKADAHNHGIGLQSIREIVKRYQGEMEIQREEETFELFLYLQIENTSL